MEHTVAIGPYAAHILEIIWNGGSILIAMLGTGVGYLIGKERGQGQVRREHRRIEQDRMLRAEVLDQMRREIRREVLSEDGIRLATPRPDHAHTHDCKAGCNQHRRR